MRDRLLDFWEAVKVFWGKLSRMARILLLSGIAVFLVLITVLTVAMNQKHYALLYNDLSTSDYAKVLSVLNDVGITPKVELSGAIYVEESQINQARMQLAAGGFPGNTFAYNYAPGLTATQQDKNVLQTQDLQDRLQATIETFNEVDQAVVTLSIPEKNAFALQTDVVEPSASIMIVKRPGASLSSDQIQGILNIVKNAVPGLTEENISLTDSESGDLKSANSMNADVNNAKLHLKQEVDSTIRSKVLSMIQPLVGSNGVEVQVNSTLDTDSKSSQITTYVPFDETDPTRNPLDYTEHNRDKVDAGGGIAQGVPGANDNVGTPQYGEEDASLANVANYSAHDIYDYLVSSTKEEIIKEGLVISDISVAVLVDSDVLSLSDLQRGEISAMVARASGAAEENIAVQNWKFHKQEAAAAPLPILTGWSSSQILILVGIALLILIILIALIIILVNKRKKAEEEALEEDSTVYDENGVPLVDLLSQEEDFEPIVIMETPEQKLKAQIKDLADSDPEIVAQLIKTWLVAN